MNATLSASAFMVLGAWDAAADPILDPMTCEIVTGTSATCPADPNFTSPAAGVFTLWVQNGDDGANLVSSGSVNSHVADSGHLLLAPRASLSQDAGTFAVNGGTWTNGSIEIFYAGRRRGRLFGLAVSTDATTNVASIISLDHAGARLLDPNAQAN